MNCFEARQDFRSFWRRELAPDHKAALVDHLKECSKCDSAFRAFALTAPVLHSDAEPYRSTPVTRPIETARPGENARNGSRAARSGGFYRPTRRSSAWLSMAAALALFVASASAAYLSEAAPVPTLSDAISQPEPFVQMVSADQSEANSDFGQ